MSQQIAGVFHIQEYNESGAHATFETDLTKTDTPTQYISALSLFGKNFREGLIHHLRYRLNPTNAVTYTYLIFQTNAAGNYESNANIRYESAAARADDTDYELVNQTIPFKLTAQGFAAFYIATDWSGAAGNTTGCLTIAGVFFA